MLILYFSDDSIQTLKDAVDPSRGSHVGVWLPVLREAIEWRESSNTNQIAVTSVPMGDFYELLREVPGLQQNSPIPEEALALIRALRDEVAHATPVEWIISEDPNELPVAKLLPPEPKPRRKPKAKPENPAPVAEDVPPSEEV